MFAHVPPFNRTSLWITRQSFLWLLVYWVGLYVLIGIAFGVVYRFVPHIKVPDTDKPTYLDMLHFSFTTQATVGYGDLTPAGWARLVAAVQALVGTTMNALALGVTTYKFLRRSSPIQFPRLLAYDPAKQEFWLRYWNTDADDLRELRISLTVFQAAPQDAKHQAELDAGELDVGLSNVVEADHDERRWAPSLRLYSLRTQSNGGLHHHAVGQTSEPLLLSPLNLLPGTSLRVDVKGNFQTTGDGFYVTKHYTTDDIRCGKYKDFEKTADSKKGRARLILGRFNTVIRTRDGECKHCPFHAQCPLDVATRIRGDYENGRSRGP